MSAVRYARSSASTIGKSHRMFFFQHPIYDGISNLPPVDDSIYFVFLPTVIRSILILRSWINRAG